MASGDLRHIAATLKQVAKKLFPKTGLFSPVFFAYCAGLLWLRFFFGDGACLKSAKRTRPVREHRPFMQGEERGHWGKSLTVPIAQTSTYVFEDTQAVKAFVAGTKPTD